MGNSSKRGEAQDLALFAHDLRTPLSAIRMLAGLIEQDGLSERQRERMALLTRSVDALNAITATLVEADQAETMPEGLVPLFEDVCQLFAVAAEAKGLALNVDRSGFDDASDRPLDTHAAAGMRRALSALIDNAVKYTSTGEVKVELRHETDADGDVEIVLHVHDTGPGILEDERQRVFEQYMRGRNQSAQIPGAGLGLWGASEQIRDLGGTLNLLEGTGIGACFEIRIAASCLAPEVASAEDIQLADHAYMDQSALHVLVVDDNEVNRLILSAVLESFSVSCDLVPSGKDAAALAAVRSYGAVFLDLHMPDMDGVDTALALKRVCGTDLPPLVAVTAAGDTVDRDALRAVGIQDVVLKPVSPESLFELLVRLRGGDTGKAVAIA
ncbi:MAG: response regulator [Rhodobacteraceae bacterium]|nr:response regulator [Paracoccaceae bacterium]